MKTGSIVRLLVAAVAVGQTCVAEPGEVGSGMASLRNGVSVHIVTKAEPPGNEAALKLGNRYGVETGVLHRAIVDGVNRTYFGYDFSGELMAGTAQCRITISPLTRPPDSSFKPVLLPSYPAPQVVSNGDTIALDILTTPDGRQKIVDYIDVSCKTQDGGATAFAQDASVDDLQMALSEPAIYSNGSLVSGPVKGAHLSGTLVWFYVPGKGRFIFSLVPRQTPGFAQAGTVREDTISFSLGADQFVVKGASTIFGTGQPRNVYVFHDKSFDPKSGPTIGSATRLEQLRPAR